MKSVGTAKSAPDHESADTFSRLGFRRSIEHAAVPLTVSTRVLVMPSCAGTHSAVQVPEPPPCINDSQPSSQTSASSRPTAASALHNSPHHELDALHAQVTQDVPHRGVLSAVVRQPQRPVCIYSVQALLLQPQLLKSLQFNSMASNVGPLLQPVSQASHCSSPAWPWVPAMLLWLVSLNFVAAMRRACQPRSLSAANCPTLC